MDPISYVIIGLAVIDLGALLFFGTKFNKILGNFESKCIDKNSKYNEGLNKTGALKKEKTFYITYKEAELEENRDKYEWAFAWYSIFSQAISLFPLLGIFGTVWGLAHSDLKDVDNLVSGLSLALRTTIYGLIASISLKLIDSWPSYLIQRIDAEFEKADNLTSRQLLKKQLLDARDELIKDRYE